MSTPKKLNMTTRSALAKALAAGAGKHYPAGTKLPIGGESLTIPEIQAKLTSLASLRSDVVTARSALTAKLVTEAAQAPDLIAFLDAFVQVVRGSFTGQPDVLADFGLKPPKARTPLTAEQQAAAKAKRKATRDARGTTGSKAKQAIHGDVTGVVVTPVTAPKPAAAPAAAATAPAPSPGATGAVTPPATRS
jgi:hypothetical protein